MNAFFYLLLSLVAVAVGYFIYQTAVKSYLTYRGTRVVKCPETGEPVAVEVDAKSAAAQAVKGKYDIHLSECTRWPERKDCGQWCLEQVESSPEDCLLKTILRRWYEGKSCALCGKAFSEIHWHDHKPCLMDSQGATIEWKQFKPETVGVVLASHQPVCWDCHIAQAFRRQFPDLVVDREWKSKGKARS